MKKLDVVLRDWRHRIAEPYVPEGSRLLDIGGFDGSFLQRVSERIVAGACLDPAVEDRREGKLTFVRARITDCLPFPDSFFDVVTMLAVFEHLSSYRERIVGEIHRVLVDGGKAILTVPSPVVDDILKVLIALRVVDGMALDEHEHFKSSDTIRIFGEAGFRLTRWSRFQLGLNNLFVFGKVPG